MTIALTALVLCSLSPSPLVSSAALGQQKVQIIKGKKGTVKAANAASETAIPVAPEAQGNNKAKAQELDRKSAELDARSRDLAQREEALQQKEADADKKKADQLKAQQKHLQKIGETNQQLWQQSSDALAGD